MTFHAKHFLHFLPVVMLAIRPSAGQHLIESRVVIQSDAWELVGDVAYPPDAGHSAVGIMLHRAGGDRSEYIELARQLNAKGIASLRVDLPGHGESTNNGRFTPGEVERNPMIWDAERDVRAIIDYVRADPRVDPTRIAVVGASYTGEEMAEAGRLYGYQAAYVALSPGSFSEASIAQIDSSGTPWLFVVANQDRYLTGIEAEVRRRSKTVEMIVVPSTAHATELFDENNGLNERIAVWLAAKLSAH